MDANERLKQDALRMLKEERSFDRRLRMLLARIIKSLPATSNPVELVHALHVLQTNPFFLAECEKIATSMVTGVAKAQLTTWREAAAASTNGRKIYQLLKSETSGNGFVAQTVRDIIRENASKIKTVPNELAKEFTSIIQERQMSGLRPNSIIEELRAKAPELSQKQAKTIARTESGKAVSALQQARATAYRCPFYIWRTSRDSRVRDSHELMDGVICRWDDPPNPEVLAGEDRDYGPYHPRGIFNCRCNALYIVRLQDIKFPVKAHLHGKIHQVSTLKAFKKLYGISDEADEEESA